MPKTIDVRSTLGGGSSTDLAYSIGTLVRDMDQYDAMRRSFAAMGFDEPDCEFLIVDNRREDQWDAYRGLNAILNVASGRHVILCHEDVRIFADHRRDLDRRIAELSALDPLWAVAGNAGAPTVGIGNLAIRISDPHGEDTRRGGPFPVKVMSLDENFLVVRRDTRVAFSSDLSGFHFYGADLCLNAEIRGHSSYVIDFHLRHLSAGRISPDFHACGQAFAQKWGRALRPRTIQTTCALIQLRAAP